MQKRPLRPPGTSPKYDVEALGIHTKFMSYLGEDGRGPVVSRPNNHFIRKRYPHHIRY